MGSDESVRDGKGTTLDQGLGKWALTAVYRMNQRGFRLEAGKEHQDSAVVCRAKGGLEREGANGGKWMVVRVFGRLSGRNLVMDGRWVDREESRTARFLAQKIEAGDGTHLHGGDAEEEECRDGRR